MNARGDLAVSVRLQGAGVNSSNNLALYLIGSQGDMHPVARTGDRFEYRPGVVSVITRLPGSLANSPPPSMNDLGQVMFGAEFENGLQGLYVVTIPAPVCYPNCDGSTAAPILNVLDFVCFQTRFAASDPYADCDQSGALNVNDFVCFQVQFAAGCP
jgi:hypothetical protein